jgi:hypothetical protein
MIPQWKWTKAAGDVPSGKPGHATLESEPMASLHTQSREGSREGLSHHPSRNNAGMGPAPGTHGFAGERRR